MASKSAQDRSVKPSFAKVAAMAAPPKSKTPQNLRQTEGPLTKENLPPPTALPSDSTALKRFPGPHPNGLRPDSDVLAVSNRMAGLTVAGPVITGPTESIQEKGTTEKSMSTFEDDQSHLSNSSTKPTSLSMASVTTFALDEKESLRPDDSASVQATEEDDSVSGAASGATNSQAGSDNGIRPFRDQYREISDKIGRSAPRPSTASSNIPRLNDGGLQLSTGPIVGAQPNQAVPPASASFANAPSLPPMEPDEKLLEAMATPKDRLLLLQFEEKIIAFIQSSKDESLDLPPCNSFGRLLAHKLADYYQLTHYVTEDNTSAASVRVFRTSFCRLPPPLSVLQNAHATSTPPPNGTAAFKIMRRAGFPVSKTSAGASTTASSSVPSKATSESGGEDAGRDGGRSPPLDGTSKDKATLTMEQKQAKYQAARERIFGDFQETNAADSSVGGDTPGEMSRSSSSSGKKKTHKQRMPRDDSFEARSQFNVWYPGMQFQPGQTQYSGTTPSMMYPQVYPMSPGNGLPMMGYPANTGQPFSGYDGQSPMNGMAAFPAVMQPQYAQSSGWQHGQSPPQTYSTFAPANHQTSMMSQQSSNRSSPSLNQFSQPASQQYTSQSQQWLAPTYQGAYQHTPVQRSPPPVHWPNFPPQPAMPTSIPYQYGELPTQPYSHGLQTPANQHPIPGSFNRSTFNPQTRSFVPGSGSPARHVGKTNPQIHAGSFNTAADGLLIAPPSPSVPQSSYLQGNSSGHPKKSPSSTASNQDSIQKKWGTPAHLPKKPPPSEVPSAFNIDNTPPLPSQQAYPTLAGNLSKGGPLIVSGSTQSLNMTGGLAAGS